MKTAVIITGNPVYLDKYKVESDSFYGKLKNILEAKGYDVSTDPGAELTKPKKADVWIGHSRGAGRLRYAPEGTLTIPIGSKLPGAVNHELDRSINDLSPDAVDINHFIIDRGMEGKINRYLEKIAETYDRDYYGGMAAAGAVGAATAGLYHYKGPHTRS